MNTDLPANAGRATRTAQQKSGTPPHKELGRPEGFNTATEQKPCKNINLISHWLTVQPE